MAFTLMHPQAARRMAEERGAQLREASAAGRLTREYRRRRLRRIRERAGWALVTLGLSLVTGPEAQTRPGGPSAARFRAPSLGAQPPPGW